ncbi:MAG: CehA/McbA family metallohydrolase [Planctomycetes bacterium]|nr:CehA/McbA family metallohydrolase [Planctomycetota bacterium]
MSLALVGWGLESNLWAQGPKAGTRLEARIVDDASGEPLAARVAVTNPDGKFVEIDRRHEHVQYLGKRWCYVDGSFALTIPEGGVQLEILRGFETRPLSATVAGNASGKSLQKTFRLRRWIDMRRQGYSSGDIHAHLPVPKEAHFQMRAEDLGALTLLHVADPENPIATNKCFTGRLDASSTPDCEIYVGQEVQDWQMGHLNMMGLTRLIPGYPCAGGTLEYWTSRPHWDLMRALRGAREQNGTVFWPHMSSLPGAECPIALALGLLDGIELITWNDPTQLPNHWSPWLNSGMSQAEFPVLRGVDLYYLYLNAGLRVPIAAGTDKFGEEIPLGSNRVYAKVQGPATYASWLAAVKAGKGFVTNGPILEFETDGAEAGDVVEFHGAKRIKARVTARSILPFTTLEIVLNGDPVGHKTLPIPKNAPKDGLYSMEVKTTVELTHSGWLAARVVDHPDLRNRILPRDVSVFAHTDPIYFLQDGRKVREEASIAYLCKYVKGVLHWLDTNPHFTNEEDRREARRAAEEALRFYESL